MSGVVGSEEELQDLYEKYTSSSGSLETILASIMCSTYVDEERFVELINTAIASKRLPAFPAWKKSLKNSKGKAARLSKGKAEEIEAEKYARELGVYDQLNGNGKGKGKAKGKNVKKEDDEAGLQALIQGNQAKKMDAMFDSIAAKYEAKEDRKQKRRSSDDSDSGTTTNGKKKKVVPAEPSEEEFKKLQEAMEARRKSGDSSMGGKKKRKKSV